MARERPTSSEVDDSDLTEYSASGDMPAGHEPYERADIVRRAGRLGFSQSRVATALGISHDELARIERLND